MAVTKQTGRSVGFAGLGAMGFGMATNLLKAGISVSGFDVNPKALENLAGAGGAASSTVRAAAAGQSRFFIMVANPEQADSVIFGADGLLAAGEDLPRDAVVCFFSTLPPQYIEGLPGRLKAAGRGDLRVVDCPVSGGVVGAQAGKLSIMLGGEKSTIEEIQPELDAMSAPGRLFFCGGLGAASTVKMLNQLLAGTHVVVAGEAITFAKALGLSTAEAYNTLMSGVGQSWIMGDRGAIMLTADFWARSAVTIFTKDLGIVNDAADGVSLPSPIASVALQAFIERAARGFGRDDDASVVCIYEDAIGKSVAEANPTNEKPKISSPATTTTVPAVALVAADDEIAGFLRSNSSSSSSSGSPELTILSMADQPTLDKSLGGLPKGSVVGVSGLEGLEARTQALRAKYPDLRFTDFHVVPTGDKASRQILVTASPDSESNVNIPSAIQAALAPSTTTQPALDLIPITGPFGAATSMYLVIRLACIIHVAAAAECCRLATARGVSSELVYSLIAGAAGSSAQFNMFYPSMLTGKFDDDVEGVRRCAFETFGQAMEDLKILKSTIQRIKYPARLLDAAYQVFKGASRKVTPAASGKSPASVAAVVLFYDQFLNASPRL